MLKNASAGLIIALLVVVTGADAASNACPAGTVPTKVSGQIFDNFTPNGTLGVVHLNVRLARDGVGRPVAPPQKMKCGIVGSPAAMTLPGQIRFTHMVSCDDQLEGLDGSSLHSFVVLLTTGAGSFTSCGAPYPPGAISGSFNEVSVPVPGTGRGLFHDVTVGHLDIEGVVSCLGAIDLEFQGEFCRPEP